MVSGGEAAVDDVHAAIAVLGDSLVVRDDDCRGAAAFHLGADQFHHLLAEVGSSNNTSFGSFISVRPFATRCR